MSVTSTEFLFKVLYYYPFLNRANEFSFAEHLDGLGNSGSQRSPERVQIIIFFLRKGAKVCKSFTRSGHRRLTYMGYTV